jgi:purine-nucleoside phosphorylase
MSEAAGVELLRCLDEACDYVKGKAAQRPVLGIVCGSGLSEMGKLVENAVCLSYGDIPHMPTPKVPGHDGHLLLGELRGTPVAVLCGRVHVYEGWPLWQVVFGVRLLRRLGAETVVLSNAAGSIDPAVAPGSLCLLRDHLNLMGLNPLVGANIDAFGPRFPDMSQVYDRELARLFRDAAEMESVPMGSGVYAAMLGPSYETPAEIRYLRAIGATLVGMSTVPEAIALRHMGARVVGISVVSNLAAGVASHELDHAEVKEIAHAAGPNLQRAVARFAQLLAERRP